MQPGTDTDTTIDTTRCPRCRRDNEPDARFCRECGGALRERCPRCAADVPCGARFCTQCGAGRPSEHAIASVEVEAERRHLSVLFCDVVGSTPISERLDAEDFREVLRAFQHVVAAAVRAHDGCVAQYIGDGVVAHFGAPNAHEDAARRAVLAGREILAGLARLNDTLERDHALRLQVRIGIHSGMVVLGEIGDADAPATAAIGETMHVASRLCDQGLPDEVVVSGATHRLVEGAFETESLGSLALRGISTAVAAFRVTGERAGAHGAATSRLGRRQTPFVDREPERATLVECWSAASSGEGRVVLLSGEPGIGKSRLIHAFREQIASDDHMAFGTECSPYHRASALYPILRVIERALDFPPDETPPRRIARLERLLGPFLRDIPDAVPLLASLLSIDLDGRYALPTMTPQRQRRVTLEVLLSLMVATTRIRPVLIVIDDLHWADPSTLDFLGTLIEQTASARLLTILAHRPEFVPPWPPHAHVTRLGLGPLRRARVEAVVRGTVEPGALDQATVAAVAERAAGNPLFAEELARMMVERHESDGADVDVGGIPPTLRDWLAARLDHVGPAKLVAQVASTIGKTFSYKLLSAIAPLEESRLREGLARLAAADLVYQRGLPPRASYTFKHALVRDAAYQSLLRSERRRYHLALARTLEDGFPEVAETEPEVVAGHYTEANQPGAAIGFWLRAAERAIARSANAEAIAHVRRGLELVPALADRHERAGQELALLATLAMPLALQHGYAAPEIDHVFARARALAEQLGSSHYLFGIVRGMLGFAEVGARYDDARRLAEELARLADDTKEGAWAIEAAWQRGSVALFTGRLVAARRHLEHAVGLYDPALHRLNAYLFGEDPGVMANVHLSLACWVMGEADTAVRHAEDGVALARTIDHPNSLAMALCFAAGVYQGRGDVAECVAHAEDARRLAEEQHFPLWSAMATVYLGWAASRSGGAADGIVLMRDGIARWEATGAREGIPAMQALVADALLCENRAIEASATIEQALARAQESGERFYEPDLHRLRASARRMQAAPDEDVERAVVAGMDLARECGSRTFELRLALELGRVRVAQGRAAEGRTIVAAARARMPEGDQTADVRDARAFLEPSSTAERVAS